MYLGTKKSLLYLGIHLECADFRQRLITKVLISNVAKVCALLSVPSFTCFLCFLLPKYLHFCSCCNRVKCFFISRKVIYDALIFLLVESVHKSGQMLNKTLKNKLISCLIKVKLFADDICNHPCKDLEHYR